MEANINPFRKAGLALLVIGIIDVGVMVYCIANEISYSSSLNIFAVIAGVLLLRGGIRTARVVRWFSAFLATSFVGLLLTAPLVTPFDLLMTQLKLNPLAVTGSFLFGIAGIAVLIWVHLQLATTESLNLLAEAGYKTGAPKSAYMAGAVLLALVLGISIVLLNGESAEKAKALAKEELGDNFRYYVSSLSISGDTGRAIVTAYSDKEIRSVQVRW